MQLSQMEDIGGCRITLNSQPDVDAVVRHLKKNWTPARVDWSVHRHRDYVHKPKASGYRAHHLIVERDGIRLEVQIRTERQDFWANRVEYDTRVTRDDLKSGQGPQQAHDFYVAMTEFLAYEDRNEAVPAELSKRIADLYDDVSGYLSGNSSDPGAA